jgi:hypothetical protein
VPLCLQEIEKVFVSKTIVIYSFFELCLDALNVIANDLKFLGIRFCLSSCDDVHIDFASRWISSRLLECIFDEHHSFFDITFLDNIGEAHLGE